MKTRLSIDTDFKIYRAIIAKTKNSIADDDFIVHRGDINKPGENTYTPPINIYHRYTVDTNTYNVQ